MLEVEYVSISDDAQPQRDGSIARYKKYVFYIGKHGPFTERFTPEEHSTQAVADRVAALRRHLEDLPR